jgi:hypothetical protein
MLTIFEINRREFEAVFPLTRIDDVIRKLFAQSQLVEKIRGVLGPVDQTITMPMDAGA